MAKRCKKKAGLHKKISTVFKGVSIPQREDDQQNSQTHSPDGPCGSASTSTPKGSLISKSSLIKKVCRSKSSSNKTTTDRKKPLLPKRKISTRSASKDSPVLQRKNTRRDEATLDHTVDVSSKQKNLDQLIPQSSKREKSPKAKDSSDNTKPGRTVDNPSKQTNLDQLIPQSSKREKSPKAKDSSDNAKPGRTVDVSSKQKNLDQLIPQSSKREKSPKAKDSSDNAKPGRTVNIPPRLTAPDEPIPRREPLKEHPQNEKTLDNAEPDRAVEAPPKQPLPELSLPPHLPAEDTLQTQDPLNNDTSDHVVDIPSWMMSPDYPDNQWNPTNEPKSFEDLSSQAESDRTEDNTRTDQDERIPLYASAEESPQTENVSDKVTPRKKSWVPPKLFIQNHAISQDSSIRKLEEAENEQDKAASRDTDNTVPQSTRENTLDQDEEITNTSAPDRMTKTSPIPKSEEPRPSRDFDSEKRYGPEAPSRKAVLPGQQRETTVLPKASGPSLWQQINNKLFAPKPGANPTKQKVMMLSIPILAIIMIFLFRQFLSKSPRKTKGDTSKDVALVASANTNHEIDWQIPGPLPATMRDPTKFSAQNNTQNEKQSPTTNTSKSESVNIRTIVYSHNKQSAVVNGRIVHPGETVSGVTVLKINKDSVVFEKNGEKWVQRVHERKQNTRGNNIQEN